MAAGKESRAFHNSSFLDKVTEFTAEVITNYDPATIRKKFNALEESQNHPDFNQTLLWTAANRVLLASEIHHDKRREGIFRDKINRITKKIENTK
ncbi:MAG TPA: hypothetical protein VG965_00830 [Patescibacteria group bacterium]|nr:hypothetical protein [Patescibacteria group bacterium]